MLRVAGLTKRYGRTVALQSLDLAVPDGAVFGLLGPNGSGKSTFLKLLLRFIYPDAGTMDLGGLAPRAIGYVPERPFFPMRSPLDEYLRTAGGLSGLRGAALEEAVSARLEQVGLTGVARQRIGACSRGMLQRLALAASLLSSQEMGNSDLPRFGLPGSSLHNPPLLLWDEPLSGLDPAWQRAVREIIRELAAAGTTVVLSTHDLGDVEQVCTHVAILRRGRLLRARPLSEVLAPQPDVTLLVDRLPEAVKSAVLALAPGATLDGQRILLRGPDAGCKAQVLRELLEAGVDVQGLSQARTTLEEIYLEAMRQ
jgi:ABC-2 type transport system ATP-binding protein